MQANSVVLPTYAEKVELSRVHMGWRERGRKTLRNLKLHIFYLFKGCCLIFMGQTSGLDLETSRCQTNILSGMISSPYGLSVSLSDLYAPPFLCAKNGILGD